MKSFGIASAAAAVLGGAALFATQVSADVDPIVIKGQHFFYKTNGSEFFIRGVAYQQDVDSTGSSEDGTFVDPLSDETSCTRDIPYLEKLGTNTIRVYSLNASLDHSACMSALADAGIYVVADLATPDYAINRDDPEWTTTMFAQYAAVIDNMANYTNTLGFFAGNEVSNQANNTNAAAFVKAAVRDMKSYIVSQGYRDIGVGYATADVSDIRTQLADYFNCGSVDDSVDFWGYNIYSWCGDSDYETSGYADRTAEFSNYSVPAFFAEYGCNDPSPRTFTEVQAIFGDNMTEVWSGGIVYEYFQETNDYGLVTVSGSSASTLSDFNNLSKQLKTASPSSTNSASYSVTNTALQTCPTVDTTWEASSDLPPIANADLCDCMVASLTCVAKSTISSNETSSLFSYICGTLDSDACAGIDKNATTGVYGSYSMCDSAQQLSFIMNQYYLNQDKDSSACDFSSQATTQSASTASACKTLLSQAGTAGTGTVSATPTGAVTTATGTAASGSSTATKTGAAGAVTIGRVDTGALSLGVYVVVAMIAGAGMIVL